MACLGSPETFFCLRNKKNSKENAKEHISALLRMKEELLAKLQRAKTNFNEV